MHNVAMRKRSLTRHEIRDLLISGQITWESACTKLKSVPRQWTTKEWKERRKEILGDCCETCESTEDLQIQHKWHPPVFSDLCEMVKPGLWEEYEITHPYIPPVLPPFDPASVPPPTMIERDSCPVCGSVAVRCNKDGTHWNCNGKKNYRKCGHEFTTPVKRLWSKWTHEEEIARARYAHESAPSRHRDKWEYEFSQKFRDRICFEATLLSIEMSDRYVAMLPDDVKTLCKKCAAREDGAYLDHPGNKSIGRKAEESRRLMEVLEQKHAERRATLEEPVGDTIHANKIRIE